MEYWRVRLFFPQLQAPNHRPLELFQHKSRQSLLVLQVAAPRRMRRQPAFAMAQQLLDLVGAQPIALLIVGGRLARV
jgi:hypothetical protein